MERVTLPPTDLTKGGDYVAENDNGGEHTTNVERYSNTESAYPTGVSAVKNTGIGTRTARTI